ncbi:MAG TPA: pre-peptidase C-terminal domain-containing protein [Kofleriaceae bacterium]|nr:pre-peptidase C-terminal domain-containing protein [Kofleriaceae bacterium]
MTIVRASGIALVALLAGCGDDSNNNNKTPDAFIIHDMGIDSRACESVTPGMLDFNGFDPQGFVSWKGPITATGLGTNLEYQFEFYDNIESSLMGTFDLKAGNQSNYSTCAICVRAFERDAQGQVVKQYYQSGGSITLTEDPFTNKRLVGSLTDLQLEEVTIAQQTFVSTPVPGGKCGNFGGYAVDHDRVPNAWTCTHTDYDSGTNCNCVCGTPDPDCIINNATVVGCTTGQACFNDACVAKPANDTCAQAVTLTLGTSVMGTTAGADRNYNAGLEGSACTGFGQPGPDVVYKIDLTANQAITVTLSGLAATYDGSIALVGPGADTLCDANPIATCVAGADDKFDGQDETFTYTATTAGTYYVIVDAYAPNVGGTFTLLVN